jgi:hypothetical protein
MANGKADQTPPPYMAASLFRSTIEAFVDTTTPTKLDRHVLSNLSGGDYSALMSGLRFLRLVEEGTGKVTDAYRALINARKEGEQAYKDALGEVISTAYLGIVDGVDLDAGTLGELEKAFRDNAGVPPGQMLTKTVRFYIKSAQDAGWIVSPHITKQRRVATKKSNATKTRKVARSGQGDEGRHEDDSAVRDHQPDGLQRMPIPGVKDAFIQYPTNLTEADCALFEAIVGVLRTYVKGRTQRKEK